ncbi:MAG: ABC transporter ATPase [Sphingobacteriales bacterium]|jgi:hypothetical protein|nr:ABC transporter ATPase [Sphingobacteriales bacterium]
MDFSPQSKVWIYQSNRFFTTNEVENINCELADFTQQWTAHNQQLNANGQVYYALFIVLIVDETQANASGCSIDKSVRFIKDIEQRYGVSLFDRFQIAYLNNQHQVKITDREGFINLFNEGKIDDFTNVFNNVLQTKQDFDQNWIVPVENSWHRMLVG